MFICFMSSITRGDWLQKLLVCSSFWFVCLLAFFQLLFKYIHQGDRIDIVFSLSWSLLFRARNTSIGDGATICLLRILGFIDYGVMMTMVIMINVISWIRLMLGRSNRFSRITFSSHFRGVLSFVPDNFFRHSLICVYSLCMCVCVKCICNFNR